MACNSSKKRTKRGHGVNNLPHNFSDDLIERIITFLPIKQAARCAVLSRRFKNSWHLCRHFIFDIDFHKGKSTWRFLSIVNRIFNRHSGPKIQKFHFYFNHTYLETAVERWIQRVILKGVEEIDLDFTLGREPFILPPRLFEVESLRILKLNSCQLDFPRNLKGLCFLKTLVLRKIYITPPMIKRIFSEFLLLESVDLLHCLGIFYLHIFAQDMKKLRRLAIGDCHDVSHVHIKAPTLSTFYYCGKVLAISFHCQMPKLSDAIINFKPPRGFPQLCQPLSNLMLSLSYIHVLRVSTTFLEKLSSRFIDGAFRSVIFLLFNLKEFHLSTEGSLTYINPYDVVSFLNNCPNVENVFLDLGEYSFECGYFWEVYAKHLFETCNPPFGQLKRITLNGFKFEKLELELLKFFLKKAKVLESVTLVPAKNCQSKVFSQDLRLFDELFLSWKTSPNAEISMLKSIKWAKVLSF